MYREKGKKPLREAVKQLDQRLWHQLEEVWRQAEEGIQDAQKSKDYHQQGTPHCRAVEENLTALIPDGSKGTQFSAVDLFALSAAAALHDTGKAGDSPNDHGHVSMWEVRGRAVAFGLDQGQAELVSWIVRAHNDGDLQVLPTEPIPLGTVDVDLRPLAALFKLADTLHTDYRRVSRQVIEFSGQQAENNPKTRFRLRIRGWRFDAQGRIELYGVPKDWEDVELIHTGFEMTRREVEPLVPTLKDASFPWELTLRLDEVDLERKAMLQAKKEQQVERAFVGMGHFSEADASRFKGRDDDAQALWRRVMAMPVTLLVGDSGVGKTSLIYAGLIPLLHKARWRTAYVCPFDDPDRFVVRGLWRSLLEGEPPVGTNIVDTLARTSKVVGNCKLLIVLDQLEDVVRTPLPEMLDELRRALVAVQAGRFRNLRLLVSYRSDAEAALGPLFQEVTGSDRGLPRIYLQPLSRAGALAALESGFAEAQVAVDGPLLDAIADEVEVQTPTVGVYPPYVQMVGETLCQAAREKNEGILTEALYRARGGCDGIIGRYLLQRLAEFGEQEEAVGRIMVALVHSTGVKRRRSLDDLQKETRVGVKLLLSLLAELMDKRMIRHLGGGQYEIIHDYLALLVDREIVKAEERQLMRLREFLDLRTRVYVTHHIPLQIPDMARLYAVRERISPNDDQMRLLLHTCLLRRGPAWFWLQGAPKARYVSLLRDVLTCPIHSLRLNAVPILVQIAGQEVIPDLRELLKDEDRSVRQLAAEALIQLLRQMGKEAIPALQEFLEYEEVRVRCKAAQALAEVAGQDAIPDLRRLLKDAHRLVWEAAVQALAQVAGDEAIPELQELLKGESAPVRDSAAKALAQVAGREALSDLRALAKDRDGYVRRVAAEVLAQVAGQEAIPELRELLKDQDWRVRGGAARALAQVAGQEAIPDLRELLKKDENADVRQAAAKALTQVLEQIGQEAVAELQKVIEDQDWRVQRAAEEALIRVLEQIGPEAVPDLRELMKDQKTSVRCKAAEALARVLQQMGPEAIPNLRELLKDKDVHVRRGAVQARALAQIAGQEAIPDLRELLKDEDKRVREEALQTLKELLTEDDLAWLTQLVVRYPLAETGEAANQLLTHLDRTLYFPF